MLTAKSLSMMHKYSGIYVLFEWSLASTAFQLDREDEW